MSYVSSSTERFDPMMSLYEYLGKAAGSELGRNVYKAAKVAKVPMAVHEVSNTKYTGTIMKYPKSFLDSYFSTMPQQAKSIRTEDDDLPF